MAINILVCQSGVYASEYCNGFFVKNIIVLLKTTEISMDFIV